MFKTRSRRAHGVLGVVRACIRRAHCTDRAPNTCTEYKRCDIQTPSSVDCFPSPLDTIHVIITTSSLHIGMVGKKKGTRGRGKKTLASPEPYSPPPSPQQAVENPSQSPRRSSRASSPPNSRSRYRSRSRSHSPLTQPQKLRSCGDHVRP